MDSKRPTNTDDLCASKLIWRFDLERAHKPELLESKNNMALFAAAGHLWVDAGTG